VLTFVCSGLTYHKRQWAKSLEHYVLICLYMCIIKGVALGELCEETLNFPTLLLSFFLISKYLKHLKLNLKFTFALNHINFV
jgi:hypothetical protein